MSFPGVTTTVADCLIVHGCAQDTDANSTATSGAPTNGNLTSLTERHDQTINAGAGGGIVVITGVKATAGATGNTTSTGSTSVTHAYVTLALAPRPAVTGTLNATETGSDTLVANGTVSDPAVTGSLSAQETGSDTLVSSGKVIVQGSLNATETGADTLASSGVVIYGDTASDGLPTDVSGTNFVAITTVLPVRTGADGDLFFSGQLGFQPQTLDNGGYSVAAIWRYRTVGGSWTDVGTEIAQTTQAVVAAGVLDTSGAINVSASITTLSANTNYEVQLYARRLLASPANTVEFFSDPTDATVTSIATSSVTGTLSATETGSDTLVSTGKVTVQGSLAATETGADTLASTGKVIVQGSLAATEAGTDTLVSTGKVIVQGTLSATEIGSDTLASTGDVIVKGALAATETGADTLASTGDVIVQGSLSATESGSDTSTISGKVIVQGSLAATETGSDTVVATGDITVQGNLSATESGSDTAAILGNVIVQGSLSATEAGADTAAISGVIGAPDITGTISATEVGSDTLVASGTVGNVVTGTLNAVETGSDTAVISGKIIAQGALSATETGADTLSSTGDVFVQGILAAVESGSDTLASTGKLIVTGVLNATETGSDTLVADGFVATGPVTGDLNAQESGQDTVFAYGFTLAPRPVVEYTLRLFDSIRSPGNQRGPFKSLRGLEHAMWDRVLQKCEYQTKAYVTAADPNTWRIGYGRAITRSIAVEEADLRKVKENVWLRSKLTDLYKRVVSANPTAELHDVLTSTLYYYQVENQKR
jgi:hypothetical protein